MAGGSGQRQHFGGAPFATLVTLIQTWASQLGNVNRQRGKEVTDTRGNRARIAKVLKAKRKELGMSMETLALDAQVSRSTISRIEDGTIQNVSVDVAHRIAKAMGLTLAEVLS